MGNDVDAGVVDGAEDTVGHFVRRHLLLEVNGCDDKVALAEDGVLQIESAVRHDVHLDGFQDLDALDLVVRLFDFLEVLSQHTFIETIRDGDGLRVVGDGVVLVALRFARFGHFEDGVFAVGGCRMHVKVTLDVIDFDQFGQAAVFRRPNLTSILTKLGRYPFESERLKNVLFICAADTIA